METPIYHNDKQINTEYQKQKNKIIRKQKLRRLKHRIIFIGIVAGAVIVLGNILAYTNPQIRTVIETKTITIDNLQDKIIELQDEVVSTIKSCESKGVSEEDALIIFDSNKKASIGNFQFQVATVQFYYKKLYNRVITPKEAVLIALDTAKAQELAKDIVFKGSNKANDWYNCSKKFNIDSKLDIINKLQN